MKQLLLLFIFSCSLSTTHGAQMSQSQTMMAQSIEEHILWKLYTAIESDNLEQVENLLPELKASDLYDTFCAENYQIPQEHNEKITSLLPHYPDPFYYQWVVYNWTIRAMPPLFWARSIKMAQFLISAGLSATARGSYGPNILAYSLLKDNVEFTTFYISQCPFGESLAYAIRSKRLPMIKLLVSAGADLEKAQKVSKHMDWLENTTSEANTTSEIQQAIKKGQSELAYYQAQRKLVEEQTEIIPVLTGIIKDYAFGQVPEDLHRQQESEKKSRCTIL